MKNISWSPRTILGLVAIAAGAVLAIFFWELRVFWFQGGLIGVALIGLGGLDLWESRRRARGHAPRGLLEELREDIVGPSRGAEAQRDARATGPAAQGPAARDDIDRDDSTQHR
ncbi:hypothetical protein ACTJI8_10075 [Microbacterium sp. 22303]|uniref:hypothetical protein n=1 Tax=Microbacterium sp. 22303 TaxID=3453905 RepID=UPI003F844584